jgi:predicted homoserine dehydrogenase-like protein
MGRGIALQLLAMSRGIHLVGVSNRTLSHAERAFRDAGITEIAVADSVSAVEEAGRRGNHVVTQDPMVLCEAENIDVIIEATGEIEFGAQVVLHAIEAQKHVILMNSELDAVVGPILKVYADRAGVIYTNSDGDQPGVIMNLLRFVEGIGCRPVLAGNMKGLQDPYRTPETQKAFAERYYQKPRMVTSFADGTKISMEMAVVANATGFRAGQRGMYGPDCEHVTEAASLFPMDQLMGDGLVDYVLGAQPGGGVFILGYNENSIQQRYLNYYKMGDGPIYVFYTPYHLCHLEVPNTVARAVLFGDVTAAPIGGPVCEVLTAAKRDLRAGEVLDGIGGFTCYGVLDNVEDIQGEGLLPMSLSEGCRMRRDVPRDSILGYDDVSLPENRLCDRLREEQVAHFSAP